MALPGGAAYVDFIPRLAAGFGRKLSADIDPETEEAANKAGEVFKKTFAGAAIAAGALLSKGLVDSINVEAANSKLAAQLGYTAEGAKDLGTIAGNVYAGAWGDSIESVNTALKGVLQNGLLPVDATNEQIEQITTRAIDFGNVMDQDVGQVSVAVGQLLKTGLAKNAEEAFDVLAAGLRHGVDKSGDLLDTFNEYGTQFRQLGLDATSATGLLSQGLKAGARDADIVADALKEFAIRAQDGSDTTKEGFKAIGLSADVMAGKIAKGGPEAAAALDQTLDKLREIKDPALQAQAAVALFGTQSEDLQDALYALDPSSAARSLGIVEGSAQELSDTLNNNTQVKLEAFKREALQGLQKIIATEVLPILVNDLIPALITLGSIFLDATKFISDNSTVFTVVAGIITAIFLPAIIQMGIESTIQAAKAVAAWIVMQAQASLSAIRIAASWLIAFGPIGLIVAVVIAAVIVIVKNWDTIADAAGKAAEWVKDHFLDLVRFVYELPALIYKASLGMFDGIKDAFKGALNWIIEKWNTLSFGIDGGSFLGIDYPPLRLETPNLPKFAEGGLAKGWALVGERGPELVNFGSTSRVMPNDSLVGAARPQEVHYHFEPHGTFESGYDPQEGFDAMIAMARARTGVVRVS